MTTQNYIGDEYAFIRQGTPSLADCIAKIEVHADLNAARRRDLTSGLRGIARALARPPAQLPADPRWLQPRVARIGPAALGITAKTWSNTVSNATAALAYCDLTSPPQNTAADLSADWRVLWRNVLEHPRQLSLAPALGRFVHFLSRASVAPDEVTQAHTERFEQVVTASAIRRSPAKAVDAAIFGWNLATQLIEGWPRLQLQRQDRSNRYSLQLSAFTATFRADLDRFINALSDPDPLDINALARPLRPASIRHRRAQVIRFASALVHAGVPIQEIKTLADIANPIAAKRGLEWIMARNDNKTSPGTGDLAIMLKMVAKHHTDADPATVAILAKLASRLVGTRPQGMTDKNRTRLRPFQDDANVRKLLQLPASIAARTAANPTRRAALLELEVAVAIAILSLCPIRRKNLSELHLERNLLRPGDGRIYLSYIAGEVKNSRQVEFELPSALASLIDAFLTARAGTLCPATCPWLFARRDGLAPMDPSSLTKRIKTLIFKELGLTVNTHLFRHMAAMLWLDAQPGTYESVRRLLAHANLSSTLNAYTGLETRKATSLFADLMAAKREGK